MKKRFALKAGLSKSTERWKSFGFFRSLASFCQTYWLLIFWILSIAYLELLYRLQIFKNLTGDYFFPFLFAFSAGTVIYLLISLIPAKAAGIVTACLSFFISLVYGVQIIYYTIFRTPLSLYSIGGAGDAAQFSDIVAETVLKNTVVMLLLFAPVAFLAYRRGKSILSQVKQISMASILLFGIAAYCSGLVLVSLTGDGPASQNTLYFKTFNPELSVNKLGVFTTMRQDLQKLVADSLQNSFAGEAAAVSISGTSDDTTVSPDSFPGAAEISETTGVYTAEATADTSTGANASTTANTSTTVNASATAIASITVNASAKANPADGAKGGNSTPVSPDGKGQTADNSNRGLDQDILDASAAPLKQYNVMDIDFAKLLAASGKDENFYAMNKYFSTVKPTSTNRYTGLFKGDNLILITAEAFSPYFITPDLTPTLYKMSTEGFVFKNFYNPVWGVSTSDGEYVACTGLIPKSGVWSFMKSGADYMPFCMGNQFRKLGYTTKAYHDHTYTYYKRDISHPNMGYDYKGFGNGLVVKKTWPESDLEMIDVTSGDFTPDKPFHIYYMTVSGHMNYSFTGNYMSGKNRKYVESLPYSDPSKAYIACNLELEFAMKALVEKLEALGIAEKTVIAISGDHYPYGLPRECIDELAGHKVEDNFELFKSTFILWKKGMETTVVEKPCASLDRIPTLSNLFGLEYDSRLLMGSDIFSDAPALVIFSNRSWITDRARYNTVTDQVEFFDGTKEDKAYVRLVNRIVADKFKYSAKILETNYYGKILK